ncbi:hypothetical protein K439DRAFT_1630230 [Ramaria rubella]|nr:hypothetical protein K439DRAFT_1630230 [Ramaria rubella]
MPPSATYMFPHRDGARSSSPSPSKSTLLTSIRRFTPKLKREHEHDELDRFPFEVSSHTTSSNSRLGHASMTYESPSIHPPSPSSVYCPPLTRLPSPPKRRVRVSGSRLPSGYRSKTSSGSSLPQDVRILDMRQSQSSPSSPVVVSGLAQQPLRTRLTRFMHRHSTPPCPANTTPTSSTISFPSSSSRTATTPSSSSSSPTVSQKKVRFAPPSTPRDDKKRNRSIERESVVGVITRMGSPWRKSQEGKDGS